MFSDLLGCVNLTTLLICPFNCLRPLTIFTAISTSYLSASFFALNVYLTSPCICLTRHISLSFPYLANLAFWRHKIYILILAPLHLRTSYLYIFIRSMLTPLHITAFSYLTDNLQSDLLALTETRICTTTTSEELNYSTPWRYSLFSASRNSAARLSKSPSAGGTAFLLNEPTIIQNSSANCYSSFEYYAITIKPNKTLLTIYNICRPSPISPYSQPFFTFPAPIPPLTTSSLTVISTYTLSIHSTLNLSNFLTFSIATISCNTYTFLLKYGHAFDLLINHAKPLLIQT